MKSLVAAAALAAALFASGHAHAYALDDVDRAPPERGKKLVCDMSQLKAYSGTTIRYDAPVTVHPAFVERLKTFEELARDVAIEVYGRAPKVLHHAGGFACRPTQSGRLSEHALGNAIDVDGFSLPAFAKAADKKLRGPIELRVSDAWRANGPEHEKRFFTLLLARLRERGDVFRGIIGPPTKGHAGHLHLDAGRWAYDWYDSP